MRHVRRKKRKKKRESPKVSQFALGLHAQDYGGGANRVQYTVDERNNGAHYAHTRCPSGHPGVHIFFVLLLFLFGSLACCRVFKS